MVGIKLLEENLWRWVVIYFAKFGFLASKVSGRSCLVQFCSNSVHKVEIFFFGNIILGC